MRSGPLAIMGGALAVAAAAFAIEDEPRMALVAGLCARVVPGHGRAKRPQILHHREGPGEFLRVYRDGRPRVLRIAPPEDADTRQVRRQKARMAAKGQR